MTSLTLLAVRLDEEFPTRIDNRVRRLLQRAVVALLRARRRVQSGRYGLDEVLAVEAENPRVRLAAEILASSFYRNTMDRARALVAQGKAVRGRQAKKVGRAARLPAVP